MDWSKEKAEVLREEFGASPTARRHEPSGVVGHAEVPDISGAPVAGQTQHLMLLEANSLWCLLCSSTCGNQCCLLIYAPRCTPALMFMLSHGSTCDDIPMVCISLCHILLGFLWPSLKPTDLLLQQIFSNRIDIPFESQVTSFDAGQVFLEMRGWRIWEILLDP